MYFWVFSRLQKKDIPFIEVPLHELNIIEKDIYLYKREVITFNEKNTI